MLDILSKISIYKDGVYKKNAKLTSVFIPNASDTTAAMIKIIRVKSCQDSHRKDCKKGQRINQMKISDKF